MGEMAETTHDELVSQLNDIGDKVDNLLADKERLAQALRAIADNAGKTLISMEHGNPYSLGANAAFEQVAAVASDALADVEDER